MQNFAPLTVICRKLNWKVTWRVQTLAKVNSPLFSDISKHKDADFCHYFHLLHLFKLSH